MRGIVYDGEGNRVGQTEDPGAAFMEQLTEALAGDGPVYVVLGAGFPIEFVESLRKFVPVEINPALPPGRSEIWEGEP